VKMKPFRPMLAATLKDATAVSYPVLASPKYDGIRCVIRDGKALARSLKPIPNERIRRVLEGLGKGAEGFDGELMLPYPATFPMVSSAVMSHDDEPPGDWFFMVFDRVATGEGFASRVRGVRLAFKAAGPRWPAHVRECEHKWIDGPEVLAAYEAEMLEAGHEGIMLRSLDGPYKCGRATLREGYLSKLKRFVDSEAEIVDVLELQHNRNATFVGELGQTKRRTLKEGKVDGGVMGKLVVRDLKTGVEFRIGTGFNASQRAAWWRCRDILIGRVVRYRFQEHGQKDKPRIASFAGFRDRRDLSPVKLPRARAAKT
jgi:ATP-dependent DNA ligase